MILKNCYGLVNLTPRYKLTTRYIHSTRFRSASYRLLAFRGKSGVGGHDVVRPVIFNATKVDPIGHQVMERYNGLQKRIVRRVERVGDLL